jgi:hypothetical protein
MADESEWFLRKMREFRDDFGLACATERGLVEYGP